MDCYFALHDSYVVFRLFSLQIRGKQFIHVLPNHIMAFYADHFCQIFAGI